jgi:hypothetical protein
VTTSPAAAPVDVVESESKILINCSAWDVISIFKPVLVDLVWIFPRLPPPMEFLPLTIPAFGGATNALLPGNSSKKQRVANIINHLDGRANNNFVSFMLVLCFLYLTLSRE